MVQSRGDAFSGYRKRGAAHLQTGSPTFGLTDAGNIERSFVASTRRLRKVLLSLVDGITSGSLSVSGFVAQSRLAIRKAYFTSYALGAISIFPFYTLTDRDVRILNEELHSETGFLRRFAVDLAHSNTRLDPQLRAGLYLLALRGIFERGRTEAMPAGPYAWSLGVTEHCSDCLQIAAEGPYQRDRTSGLGLPVLPGTPGDGSVCRGLTRCGCTVKLSTGIELPNSDLSPRIRELLLEVVYGSDSAASGT